MVCHPMSVHVSSPIPPPQYRPHSLELQGTLHGQPKRNDEITFSCWDRTRRGSNGDAQHRAQESTKDVRDDHQVTVRGARGIVLHKNTFHTPTLCCNIREKIPGRCTAQDPQCRLGSHSLPHDKVHVRAETNSTCDTVQQEHFEGSFLVIRHGP